MLNTAALINGQPSNLIDEAFLLEKGFIRFERESAHHSLYIKTLAESGNLPQFMILSPAHIDRENVFTSADIWVDEEISAQSTQAYITVHDQRSLEDILWTLEQ
ncbi:MAG: hypothetical protein AAF824_00120 [Bacteroidota bacterium]